MDKLRERSVSFTCSNFYQQANSNFFQLNSPHRSDPSITEIRLEVHIVLDFVITLPQQFKHDQVFVNIFATRGSGGCIDQTFQPTLKIRRLGPLVHGQKRGKSLWITDQSIEVYVF